MRHNAEYGNWRQKRVRKMAGIARLAELWACLGAALAVLVQHLLSHAQQFSVHMQTLKAVWLTHLWLLSC